MNERIEEFYSQVGLDFENFQRVTVKKGDMEKFAELIVLECMEVAHPKLTDVGEWAAGMRLVQKRLKQHFGVEE